MKHFLALSALLCACHSQPQPAKQQPLETAVAPQVQEKSSIICPGDMREPTTDSIPTDLFAPGNRENVCGWWMPEDTTTPKGSFVKYLISNDSCCLDNLYIRWGTAKIQNIEALSPLRQFHPRMTPCYVGESDKYLFMESAASGGLPTIGWNLWLFPLESGRHSEVYATAAPEAYDLKSLTIIREVEENRTGHNFLEAYNIRTHRVKPIRLKNRIMTDLPHLAIDSVSVTPKTIFLRVETYDKNDKPVDEVVILPNDIK